MTTSAVGGPAPISYTDVDLTTLSGSVDPSMILLMLERRLGDLDTQIQGMVHDIETSTQRAEGIQRRTEALQRIRAAHSAAKDGEGKKVKLGELKVEWEGEEITAAELLNDLGITDLRATDGYEEVKEARQAEFDRLEASIARVDTFLADDSLSEDHREVFETERAFYEESLAELQEAGVYDADMKIDGRMLDDTIQAYESQARRMNANNELTMVQMQSTMQQRSQAVTMATQMMKNVTESMTAIARNMA